MKKILTAMIVLGSINASAATDGLKYPSAPTSDAKLEFHGLTVADKYQPLEDEGAEATHRWIAAENAVTAGYLGGIPYREAIRSRLKDLNNFEKRGLPERGNDGLLYYSVNDGLRNQSVIMRVGADGNEEVFLDPNTLSADGTVALTGLYMSADGRYTAYTVSRSGSDWTEIYVMETASKRLLDDHVEWAKFTDAQWDGDGFYYSAYPRPEAGREFTTANGDHQVRYHKIGTKQSEDKVVFSDPAHPLHFHTAEAPEGCGLLFIAGSGEGLGNSLMVKDLKNGGEWKVMDPSQDNNHTVISVEGGKIYILTSWGAERNRVMVADAANPGRENWTELVAEGADVLTGVKRAGDLLLLEYQHDASSRISAVRMDGSAAGEVKLPGIGTVAISASKKHPEEVYLSVTSFTSPSTIYKLDTTKGLDELEMIYRPEVKGVNFDDYVTEQVFYRSADGTKIPMFITYKKGLKKDGKNPVYLYGYGGFNISLTPGYNANRLLWLENGGIYAQANLRGGGEYGESWHIAGTKMNKLNVFEDFIAAAEYMINEGYTNKELIAIEGGSNGGLLVGATVNMRPDLMKVAIPRVGVMDMLKYHLFTIGWNWASDYGTVDESGEMARYLLGYSPLHNIKDDGTRYPAIMVTTADHDDRVVPAHSMKYAAALQAASTGDAPKIIRIDTKAGHGAGKPIAKVIDEQTDIYSFIFYNLGIEPKSVK